MGVLYLAALVAGLGIILMQLVFSSGDADADMDADADADMDADADADMDADDADVHHGVAGGATDLLAVFLSVRFWTFGALGFGLLGTLLHYLDLASTGATLALALVIGLGGGLLASYSLKLLSRTASESEGRSEDLLGQVGKVLVPVEPNRRGKVRVEVRGRTLDYIATTDEPLLGAGEDVLVEEVRGEEVHVSRVPKELTP